MFRDEFGPPLHEKLFLGFIPGGPKGKIVERSRCWPTGLGLSRAITEGYERAMGFVAAF